MTTLAGGSPGETSKFSTMLKNDTRCEDSVGAWTAIETPSRAFAVPSPNATLIASVIAVEVEKSASLIFKTICSDVSKGVATILSTVAPLGIRPEVGTPI